MISASAFIMGICHPQRIFYLKKSLQYFDKQNFPFTKKLLAIDEFDGYTFPKTLQKELEKRNWIVLVDQYKSRKKSMDHAFSIIDTDYIFYNEDDVEVDLPSSEDIELLFNLIKVRNRNCGIVSLTMGGSKHHFPIQQYGDLNKVRENILLEHDNYLAFRRLEKERSDYFFEFPALFIRTELFKLCHETAKKKYPGLQVEKGLTKAWFKQKLDKKYYKCSFSKTDILGIVCDNPTRVYYKSLLITLLDPEQGSSPFGGNHAY